VYFFVEIQKVLFQIQKFSNGYGSFLIDPKTWSFLLESKNTISYLLESMRVRCRASSGDNKNLTFLDKHSFQKGEVLCIFLFKIFAGETKAR